MPNPGKYFQKVIISRIFWKIFPGFFLNYWYRVINEDYFWKNFPAEFPGYLLRKKQFSKPSHDSEGFPDNFSRRILSIPTQEKIKKIVWKFSRYPSQSWPGFSEFQFLFFKVVDLNPRLWKKFPEKPLTHAPKICQYGLRPLTLRVEHPEELV